MESRDPDRVHAGIRSGYGTDGHGKVSRQPDSKGGRTSGTDLAVIRFLCADGTIDAADVESGGGSRGAAGGGANCAAVGAESALFCDDDRGGSELLVSDTTGAVVSDG